MKDVAEIHEARAPGTADNPAKSSPHFLGTLQADLPAAMVVFLVALPLCLGIALASGAPLISGLIAGIVGGVVVGVLLNLLFRSSSGLALMPEQLVSVPQANGVSDLAGFLTFPDFSALLRVDVYKIAIVLAIVASLETLLCVEATDKLDSLKRVTPTNRELKAQGIGNVVSGLVGGLPITQVIVRSSANIQAGARSKASAVIHGLVLAGCVVALPALMNLIPLATLAAILLVVGYKLAKPSIFLGMFRQGVGQFVPFMATVCGIVFTDLLLGIGVGIHVAVIVILFQNYRLPFQMSKLPQERGQWVRIGLAQHVTFLNKASVLKTLDAIPDDSLVEIEASASVFIHPDVIEIIDNFTVGAKARNIDVVVNGLDRHKAVKAPTGMKVAVRFPSRPAQEVSR